jgi:hypothetical protein
MAKGFLKELLRLDKTVYSFKELSLLWPDADTKTIRSRISYYIKQGDLYHIRRGFYAKDKDYDRFELATKIYTPSYISLETILVSAGINFQYYTQIFVATYESKTIICDNQTYVFRRIKPTILTNSSGIETHENYSIATPERAFLDILYLNKGYHFDNVSSINWDKIDEILPIYEGNKRMKKIVAEYKEQSHAA